MKKKLLLMTAAAFMAFGAVGYAGSHFLFNENPIVARAASNEIVDTVTFTSKSWANEGNKWVSTKDASQFETANNARGAQIMTATSGAGAKSATPYSKIKKISISCAKSGSGVGSIVVKVGNTSVGTISSFTTTLKDNEIVLSEKMDGVVSFTVTCSTNSIYVKSVTVTCQDGEDSSPAVAAVEALETRAQLGFNYSFGSSPVSGIVGDEYVASQKGFTNAETVSTIAYNDDINMIFDKGEGSTAPAYYNTGSGLRLYDKGTLTFSSETVDIRKIELTFSSNGYGSPLTTSSGYSLSDTRGTWQGNSRNVVFNCSGTIRLQKIKITYDGLLETYTFSNVKLNFGGMCSVTDWSALNSENEIFSYGVAVARTSKLSSSSIEDLVEASDESIIRVSENFAEDIVRVDEDGITQNLNGDYYLWHADMYVPSTMYGESITAVAFVLLDSGDYVFMQEAEYSVKTLAAKYKTHESYTGFSDEVKGALDALAK